MLRTEGMAASQVAADVALRSPARAAGREREQNAGVATGDPWAELGLPEFGDTVRRICEHCGWARGGAPSGRTLAITSAVEGEGKSTLATAIAIVTACDQAGAVLLVDCDLEQPRAARELDLVDGPGLAGVLAGGAELAGAVQPTGIPNLYVLPAGQLRGSPSRLLRSSAMVDLIEACRGQFAYIVLDLPAVLASSDAPVLAQMAEGTVLVVRSGVTARGDVQRALTDLSAATFHGVVLNAWRSAVPDLIRRLAEQWGKS